jgi:hypothetical protein
VQTRDFYFGYPGPGYHWNQNGQSYYLIGEAMGEAMLALLSGQPLTLIAPNGAEDIVKGTTYPIQWVVTGDITTVKLEYSSAGGAWQAIASDLPASDRSYDWTVPDTDLSDVRVRVSTPDGSIFDESNAAFNVVTPVMPVEKEAVTFRILGHRSYRLEPGVRAIRIMDLRGSVLRELPVQGPVVTWNGLDNRGQRVESGVYIVRIEATAERRPLKVLWKSNY